MASSPIKIFFLVPNIIGNIIYIMNCLYINDIYYHHTGYIRIILTILSFHYMLFSPGVAIALYIISQLLDAVDGFMARRLNQC